MVVSAAVLNLSSLRLGAGVAVGVGLRVAGAASGVALTADVVASVGVDVDLAEDVGEVSVTEEVLATGVVSEVEGVAASEEAGMTLDRRGVEVAIGSCSAE